MFIDNYFFKKRMTVKAPLDFGSFINIDNILNYTIKEAEGSIRKSIYIPKYLFFHPN